MALTTDTQEDDKSSEVWHLRHVGPSPTVENSSSLIKLSVNGSVTVGRGPTADYFLDSKIHLRLISRVHASVTGNKLPNGHVKFVLTNYGLNGTYINDFKLGIDPSGNTKILHEGDKVAFGHINSGSIQAGSYAPQPQSEFQFIFEKVNLLGEKHVSSNPHRPSCTSDQVSESRILSKGNVSSHGSALSLSGGSLSEKENKFLEPPPPPAPDGQVKRRTVVSTSMSSSNKDRRVVNDSKPSKMPPPDGDPTKGTDLTLENGIQPIHSGSGSHGIQPIHSRSGSPHRQGLEPKSQSFQSAKQNTRDYALEHRADKDVTERTGASPGIHQTNSHRDLPVKDVNSSSFHVGKGKTKSLKNESVMTHSKKCCSPSKEYLGKEKKFMTLTKSDNGDESWSEEVKGENIDMNKGQRCQWVRSDHKGKRKGDDSDSSNPEVREGESRSKLESKLTCDNAEEDREKIRNNSHRKTLHDSLSSATHRSPKRFTAPLSPHSTINKSELKSNSEDSSFSSPSSERPPSPLSSCSGSSSSLLATNISALAYREFDSSKETGLFESDDSNGEDGSASVNNTPHIIKKIYSPFKKLHSKSSEKEPKGRHSFCLSPNHDRGISDSDTSDSAFKRRSPIVKKNTPKHNSASDNNLDQDTDCLDLKVKVDRDDKVQDDAVLSLPTVKTTLNLSSSGSSSPSNDGGDKRNLLSPSAPPRTLIFTPKSPLRHEPKSPLRNEPKSPLRNEPKSPLRHEPKSPLRHEPKSPKASAKSSKLPPTDGNKDSTDKPQDMAICHTEQRSKPLESVRNSIGASKTVSKDKTSTEKMASSKPVVSSGSTPLSPKKLAMAQSCSVKLDVMSSEVLNFSSTKNPNSEGISKVGTGLESDGLKRKNLEALTTVKTEPDNETIKKSCKTDNNVIENVPIKKEPQLQGRIPPKDQNVNKPTNTAKRKFLQDDGAVIASMFDTGSASKALSKHSKLKLTPKGKPSDVKSSVAQTKNLKAKPTNQNTLAKAGSATKLKGLSSSKEAKAFTSKEEPKPKLSSYKIPRCLDESPTNTRQSELSSSPDPSPKVARPSLYSAKRNGTTSRPGKAPVAPKSDKKVVDSPAVGTKRGAKIPAKTESKKAENEKPLRLSKLKRPAELSSEDSDDDDDDFDKYPWSGKPVAKKPKTAPMTPKTQAVKKTPSKAKAKTGSGYSSSSSSVSMSSVSKKSATPKKAKGSPSASRKGKKNTGKKKKRSHNSVDSSDEDDNNDDEEEEDEDDESLLMALECDEVDEDDNWHLPDGVDYCDVPCSAVQCKNPSGKAVNWVMCDKCEQWYHLICVDASLEAVQSENTQFSCGFC